MLNVSNVKQETTAFIVKTLKKKTKTNLLKIQKLIFIGQTFSKVMATQIFSVKHKFKHAIQLVMNRE